MDTYGVEKAGRFDRCRCFSDMIRIQLDLWIRPLDLESGSGSRQAKLTHKKEEMHVRQCWMLSLEMGRLLL
jgi:hypothetical protein